MVAPLLILVSLLVRRPGCVSLEGAWNLDPRASARALRAPQIATSGIRIQQDV